MTTNGFKLTEKQIEANNILSGESTHLLLFGGSRSGKTFLIIRNIITRALLSKNSRHGIFRHTATSMRVSLMQDTIPTVLRLAFPNIPYKLNKSDSTFTFPNGSQLILAGLDDAQRIEKILGQEYTTVYLNETSEISYSARNIVLTRLAQKSNYDDGTEMKCRFYYDLNPSNKSHWVYKLFVQKIEPNSKKALNKPDDYAYFQINPMDNVVNQGSGYIDSLKGMTESNQRRFLNGEFTDDNTSALFSFDTFVNNRFSGACPEFNRIVIAVDPSGSTSDDESNDAIGIVVMGLGQDGLGYLLEDLTLKASPNVWSKVVSDAYERWDANLVVAETNYGGGMVQQVIRTHNSAIPYKGLTSSRGKHIRAEPVATLYEQGKIRHVGYFVELEDELMGFTTTGYTGGRSPNRADALVFAVQELFNGIVNPRTKTDRVINTGISYSRKQSGWMR